MMLSIRLENFSYHKTDNSLSIKIPYKTKEIFFIKNTSRSTPFGKESFLKANEICLGYIKNEVLHNQLITLLNDIRFVSLSTRMNSYASKFVNLPSYDKNNNIINAENDSETDVLTITIARPQIPGNRNANNDFSSEFLLSMIQLLQKIKLELEDNTLLFRK